MTSAGSQHCAIAVAITSGAARRTKASAPGASSRSTRPVAAVARPVPGARGPLQRLLLARAQGTRSPACRGGRGSPPGRRRRSGQPRPLSRAPRRHHERRAAWRARRPRRACAATGGRRRLPRGDQPALGAGRDRKERLLIDRAGLRTTLQRSGGRGGSCSSRMLGRAGVATRGARPRAVLRTRRRARSRARRRRCGPGRTVDQLRRHRVDRSPD
jgi:hypothetical protein